MAPIWGQILFSWRLLPRWLSGKESTCQSKARVFSPWVRNISWRRKGQPTLVFCLKNPMGRGAWWATVHGVTKRWTGLSDGVHQSTVLMTCVCGGDELHVLLLCHLESLPIVTWLDGEILALAGWVTWTPGTENWNSNPEGPGSKFVSLHSYLKSFQGCGGNVEYWGDC